jgi:adenosylcobinamide amidohydrolase
MLPVQPDRGAPDHPADQPALAYRDEDGARFPLHVWRFSRPVRAISCGPYGGGIGERHWLLNATVHRDYGRLDPDAHIAELAAAVGLTGAGSGMLTAVRVTDAVVADDGGVRVVATVGLGHPTRAAERAATAHSEIPAAGTINIVALLPVALSEAALVNAVATLTEAKVQALYDHGANATGTATDAVFVGCSTVGEVERFGGPRSTWGARLARAVHMAVAAGSVAWQARPLG